LDLPCKSIFSSFLRIHDVLKIINGAEGIDKIEMTNYRSMFHSHFGRDWEFELEH
jgi:hypothetical protein